MRVGRNAKHSQTEGRTEWDHREHSPANIAAPMDSCGGIAVAAGGGSINQGHGARPSFMSDILPVPQDPRVDLEEDRRQAAAKFPEECAD